MKAKKKRSVGILTVEEYVTVGKLAPGLGFNVGKVILWPHTKSDFHALEKVLLASLCKNCNWVVSIHKSFVCSVLNSFVSTVVLFDS